MRTQRSASGLPPNVHHQNEHSGSRGVQLPAMHQACWNGGSPRGQNAGRRTQWSSTSGLLLNDKSAQVSPAVWGRSRQFGCLPQKIWICCYQPRLRQITVAYCIEHSLTGEALKVYGRLSFQECLDYDQDKLSLLQCFRFAAGGHREHFGTSKLENKEKAMK